MPTIYQPGNPGMGESVANPELATDVELTQAVVDHVVAADPHTQYQKESEKGQANGYASLDGTGKVPAAQLPPAQGGGGVGVWGGITGTLSDQTDLQNALNAKQASATLMASISAASDTVAGKVELATSAEAITGTDVARAVTPKALKDAMDDASATLGTLAGPVVGTDNVWGERNGTAGLFDVDLISTYVVSQIPAASESTQGKVELATVAEAEAGVDTARAVTPAGVLASINANAGATADLNTVAQELFGVLRPALTSPAGVDNGDDTADLNVTTPAAGTVYVAVTASATPPTSYQILTASVPGAEYQANFAAVGAGAQTHISSANAITNGVDRYPHFSFKRTSDSMVAAVSTGSAFQVANPGDVTAPTLTSATIPAAGNVINLAFSENVSIGAGGNGGFTIAMSGGAVTMTYASGSGSSTLVYNLSRTVLSGETCSDFDYTQPGNGVEDGAGNDLATFTNQQASVTNNSTQTFLPSSLPGLAAWFRKGVGITESGGEVSQWADQSGNARHAVPFNNSVKPTVSSGVMLCNGMNAFFRHGTSPIGASEGSPPKMTIYVRVKVPTITAGNEIHFVTAQEGLNRFRVVDTNNLWATSNFTVDQLITPFGSFDTTVTVALSRDGNNWAVKIGGGSVVTDSFVDSTTFFGSIDFYIGGYGPYLLNGDDVYIAEVAIYAGQAHDLNGTDAANMFTYMNAITIA